LEPSLTRRLLGFRWRGLRRRAGGGLGVIVLLVTLVAIAALALLGTTLVASSIALTPAGAAPTLDETLVRDQVFWLGTLAALIYSYTSFEVFFRAPDARFLATLPLSGANRFDDLFIRALVIHLPLVFPAVAYAIALFLSPLPGAAHAGTYTILVGLTQFAVGLCLAIMLHLYAGRSLLSKGSEVRKLLAGMSVPDDAALLVYAPALGLFGTLVLGIFIDLAFRDAVFRGKGSLLAPVLLVSLAVAVFSVVRARRISAESLHLILPRFGEVDVPPPYREDGVPKFVPGERLRHLLPLAARPYFLRDLKQLRRRHRLDRVLLWVFAGAVLKLAHDVPPIRSPALTVLLALAMLDGVFIVSAFRLRGELASRWLDLTLPRNPGQELRGRLLATAHHPLVALVVATAMTLTTGSISASLVVLGAGLALTIALVVGGHLVARLGAERPGLTATLWRVVIASVVTVLGGVV